MGLLRMVWLVNFLHWFGRESSSTPQALDRDEAAPRPPSCLHADPRLGTRFISAVRSTFDRASVASSCLSSADRSRVGRARRNPDLPITSRSGPSSPGAPLPQLPARPTSNASISEGLPLRSPSTVLHRPNYRLHHGSNLQAARLMFHVTPGHLGSSSLLLRHAIDIDIPKGDQSRWLPASPISLGETFINVSYQAMVALLIFHFQNTPDDKKSSTAKLPTGLLIAAEVAVVVGFAASLIGIQVREVCWKVAAAIERVGSVASAVGFFLMMGMLFSTGISKGIGFLCVGASLVAFVLPIIKKKREGFLLPNVGITSRTRNF